MKKLLITLVTIGGFMAANAQQLPHFSQYFFNDFVLNPAVAGSKPMFDAKSNHRYQWVGITDAPRTYIFSLNGPLPNGKVGMGGYLFTDITGPTRRTGMQVSYAYHLKVTDDIKLSFGLSAGVLQFMVDGSKINLREENDIALDNGVQSVILPDAGAGLYLYSDKFWFSLAAPQMLPLKIQYFGNFPGTESKLANHIFANGGYNFVVNDQITVAPSVMIKYVTPAPVQLEGTLRIIYEDMVWAGASYRTQDAISFLIGYTHQENLSIGFSYDVSTSNIKNYSSGTYEMMFGIKFKNRKVKTASSID